MFSFLPGYAWFAVAGLVAAAAPIIIHLLNRRRFRIVEWAAMDFLRAAVQRNRKILNLRDLLLLLLRTAALILLGLALARPFWQTNSEQVTADGPLQVALIVDNSLSMGYQLQGRRVLDEAKERAEEVVNALPEQSMISVIPWCGSEYGRTRDAYRNKSDALEAIRRIELTDRRGTVNQALESALESFAGTEGAPSARRIVLIGDQQIDNWPRGGLTMPAGETPPNLICIDTAPQAPSNTWVEAVAVTDGVADVNTPANITAIIRHSGTELRDNVQVNLVINGEIKDSKRIELQPNQSLEVNFSYRFDIEERLPGMINTIAAAVTISPDQLPDDDSRTLIIPVAAEVPVVFIDTLGASGETPNQAGETLALRRLLAPRVSRNDDTPPLITVRHITPEQVNRDLLRDARLVVIGGVNSPGELTPLLREYVVQGGPLFIATGGGFDPSAWNEEAYREGEGILPLPLDIALYGKTADEITGAADLLTINPDSLAHAWFQFPKMSAADQAEFYLRGGHLTNPFLFKTAVVRDTDQVRKQRSEARENILQRQQAEWASLLQAEERLAAAEKAGPLSGEQSAERQSLRARRLQLVPQWLSWSSERETASVRNLPLEKQMELEQPRVIARLSNGMPLFVEQQVGAGRIVFFASGLTNRWNTLAGSNVWLVMDRILRGLLSATLPQRNLEQVEQLTLPVSDHLARYTLHRPQLNERGESREEPLTVEALGGDEYAVTIRNITQRGIYRVNQYRSGAVAGEPAIGTLFAINGPAAESQLNTLGRAGFETQLDRATTDLSPERKPHWTWIDRGAPISLAGGTAWGQSLWWWCGAAMMLCLLIEMLICARPFRSNSMVIKEGLLTPVIATG